MKEFLDWNLFAFNNGYCQPVKVFILEKRSQKKEQRRSFVTSLMKYHLSSSHSSFTHVVSIILLFICQSVPGLSFIITQLDLSFMTHEKVTFSWCFLVEVLLCFSNHLLLVLLLFRCLLFRC